MRFETFYDHDSPIVNIPISFDTIVFDENRNMGFVVTEDQFPTLVNSGVVILKKNGREFNNLDEAILYSKSVISEADEEQPLVKDPKYKVSKQMVKWRGEDGEDHTFEYALGNSKIGTDTVVINMSSVARCMSLILGLCPLGTTGQCYAMSPEVLRPLVAKYRERQEQQWSCMTPQGIADVLKQIKVKMPQIKYVRLNEYGEIRNLPKNDSELMGKLSDQQKSQLDDVDDIAKLKQIASLVPQLIFYSYTHRSDLFEAGSKSGLGSNVVLTGSGFMLDNAFLPVDYRDYANIIGKGSEAEIPGYGKLTNVRTCKGNCAICNYCKKNAGQNILIPIHGSGSSYDVKLRQMKDKLKNSPEFDAILQSDKTKEEKVKAISLLGNIYDPTEELKRLINNLPDRKEWWTGALDDENTKQAFLDAIVAANNPIIGSPNGKMAGDISIKALQGKLQSDIERHKARGESGMGSAEFIDKKLSSLNKYIAKAKTGELSRGDINKDVANRWKVVARKSKKKNKDEQE